MTEDRNNIQQYIEEYKNTLEKMGAETIKVRVCNKWELDSGLKELDDEVKNKIRNPSKQNSFWLGSSLSNHNFDVWYIGNNGNFGHFNYYVKNGVRPVIEIPIF